MDKAITPPEFEVGDKVVLKNPQAAFFSGTGEVIGGGIEVEGQTFYLVAFGRINGAFTADEMQFAPVEVGVPIECLCCGEKHIPQHGYDLCCSPECYSDIRGEL